MTKTRVSVLVMLLMVVFSFYYLDRLGLRTQVLESSRTATIRVDDTNSVIPGARVLMRGVQIGYVKKITPSTTGVDIEWTYDDKYSIPTRSQFSVDDLSALGEPYISVLPSTDAGPFLADHAVISAAQTSEPTSFQEMSRRLTLMLEQIDPAKVRDIFDTMNLALPDGQQVLGNLNRAGELLAGEISQQGPNFSVLFRMIQPLLLRSGSLPTGMAGATPNILATGQGLAGIVNSYYDTVRDANLPNTMIAATPFLAELQKFLDESATSLHTLGYNLLPAVQASASALQTVPVSQLLQNALAATSSGAVTVHVGIPGR